MVLIRMLLVSRVRNAIANIEKCKQALNLVFAMEVCVCLDIYGAWEGALITA